MKGLLTSLITVLTFTGLQAQSLPTAPKLVVGLTIDQLRTDYLEAFSSLYGERGFKRLWKEGRVFHNAEYTFSGVDRASAMAAIYSGSTPSVNGIISNRWMDVATLRPVNSTDDCRRTENSDTRQRYRIRHRPFLRRSHFRCRTCRKRSVLDQSHDRKMERNDLLWRIPLVGKPI